MKHWIFQFLSGMFILKGIRQIIFLSFTLHINADSETQFLFWLALYFHIIQSRYTYKLTLNWVENEQLKDEHHSTINSKFLASKMNSTSLWKGRCNCNRVTRIWIHEKHSSLFDSESHLALSFFLRIIPRKVILNFLIWIFLTFFVDELYSKHQQQVDWGQA